MPEPKEDFEDEADGGLNVKTSPSVVIVVGFDTFGIGTVSVPSIMRNEPLDTTIRPSGSVNVLGSAVIVLGGLNVNTSPSVVMVVGCDTLGIGTVSVPPMMRNEPLDTTT